MERDHRRDHLCLVYYWNDRVHVINLFFKEKNCIGEEQVVIINVRCVVSTRSMFGQTIK